MIELGRASDGLYELHASQWLPRQPGPVFAFCSDCRHMNRVVPPWIRFDVLHAHAGPMQPEDRYEYVIRWRKARLRWRTRITDCQPPHRFVDVQELGPYRFFEHEHVFEPADGGTLTRDVIRYLPPGGLLSPLVNRWLVGPDLLKLFEHRHRRMAQLFAKHEDPVVEDCLA